MLHLRNIKTRTFDSTAMADHGSALFQAVIVKGISPIPPPSFSQRGTIDHPDEWTMPFKQTD
jgi:hypothetical protein